MMVAPTPASLNCIEKKEPTRLGSPTSGAQFHVAASAIRKEAGVDDELNRLVAEFVNRLDHFVGELAGSAVDDKRSLIARLHHDVPAIAKQHVDVAGNRPDVNLAVVRFGIHGAADRRRTRRGPEQCLGFGIGRGFELGREFRIDRRRAGNTGQQRDFVSLRIFSGKRLRAERIIRHRIRRPPHNLLAVVAGVEPGTMVGGLAEKVVAADFLFGQKNGIGDNRGIHQMVAMTDDEFHHAWPDRFPEVRCAAASPA